MDVDQRSGLESPRPEQVPDTQDVEWRPASSSPGSVDGAPGVARPISRADAAKAKVAEAARKAVGG